MWCRGILRVIPPPSRPGTEDHVHVVGCPESDGQCKLAAVNDMGGGGGRGAQLEGGWKLEASGRCIHNLFHLKRPMNRGVSLNDFA